MIIPIHLSRDNSCVRRQQGSRSRQSSHREIREKEKGGRDEDGRLDGFSMRVLARSGRTEREMNFGKREMADPVDAQSGKRRNTAVRQFPDVITGPCSRAETPGTGESRDIALFSAVNAERVAKRLCYSVASSPPSATHARGRENGRGGCIVLNPRHNGRTGAGRKLVAAISNIQGTRDILNVYLFSAGYWKRHASRARYQFFWKSYLSNPSRVPCAESIK